MSKILQEPARSFSPKFASQVARKIASGVTAAPFLGPKLALSNSVHYFNFYQFTNLRSGVIIYQCSTIEFVILMTNDVVVEMSPRQTATYPNAFIFTTIFGNATTHRVTTRDNSDRDNKRFRTIWF